MNVITKPTPADIRKQFKAILGTEHVLNQSADNKNYYPVQEKLRKQMVEFLRTDFSVLNSRQILKLASLVSTHRPVAPHSFLITCGNLIND